MIHPLYLDFLKFLDRMGEEDPWPSYRRLYLDANREFLAAYWENFDHFDLTQIAGRVRAIKKGDYGLLRALIEADDPAILAAAALDRCQSIFPQAPVPPVYLFVGFFSADGTTVEVDGTPSIAIGLERFRTFKDLPLLVAHEYAHCAQHLRLKSLFPPGERNLLFTVIAEALSIFFSELAYPEIPLHRHLFITPERLQWCREHQETLLELAGADLNSPKLVPILFGPGDPMAALPPRTGYFIAREMLGHCLSHHGAEEFGQTFPGFEDLFRRVLACGLLLPGKGKGQTPS